MFGFDEKKSEFLFEKISATWGLVHIGNVLAYTSTRAPLILMILYNNIRFGATYAVIQLA